MQDQRKCFIHPTTAQAFWDVAATDPVTVHGWPVFQTKSGGLAPACEHGTPLWDGRAADCATCSPRCPHGFSPGAYCLRCTGAVCDHGFHTDGEDVQGRCPTCNPAGLAETVEELARRVGTLENASTA